MGIRTDPLACRALAESSRSVRKRVERAQQAGFSAPEVVVGVFLFVSLVTAARPVFNDLVQTYALHGAARGVFAQLQSARMAAVANNKRYRFSIDATQDAIVSQKESPTSVWTQVAQMDVAQTSDGASGGSAVTVSATGDIVFAPNGSAPVPGTVTVMNRLQRYKRIVVEASGYVGIE